MAKGEKDSKGIEKRGGYKPMNEGYQPSHKKGYQPTNSNGNQQPSASSQPAPPKGGTGESSGKGSSSKSE